MSPKSSAKKAIKKAGSLETGCFGIWLRIKDLNPDKLIQSQSCYHYTNPQYVFATDDYYNMIMSPFQVQFAKFELPISCNK